ncbi:hypothetical protein KEJ52_04605, partial [Candidatus Bathyarchaeota archaeon]|nr:hypothetical protein [Candidatus Bathyarchaeota archaeon]
MVNSSKKFGFKTEKRGGRGVSPAISTVIVTAATVVLVLVASQYAYRIMEQNRGAEKIIGPFSLNSKPNFLHKISTMVLSIIET